MAEQPTRRPKRADIQGLRALAVGLVVLAHAGVPGVAGGFIGVDVFFVISGFLITGLLVKEGERSGKISISSFYSRRARRILPASTLVLVATVGFAAVWESTAALKVAVTDAIWSALFLANVHFANIGTDYSAGEDPSPMQHYWSLAVEEQFYVVWPLLFLALFALGVSKWRLTVAVLAVWALSLGWAAWSTADSAITAYFSSPARAYELATGALVAVATPWLAKWRRGRSVVAVLGLAAVVLAALAYDGSTPFPGVHALLPVLGTALVIAAGTGTDEPPTGLLSMQPFQRIGDLSFSIYLWHWPILIFGASRVDGWIGTALLLALTLLLSELTYRYVEIPFQHGKLPKMKTRFALTLWPVSVAMVVASTSLATSYGDAVLEQSRQDAAEYYDKHPDAALALHGVTRVPVEKKIRRALNLADRDAPIPPELENGGDSLTGDIWQEEFNCYADLEASSHRICPMGDKDSQKTVVLLGDSHAGMWLYSLDRVAKRQGFKVLPLIKIGCAPYDVPQTYRGDAFPSCDEYRSWSRQKVNEIAPDAVVLGHRGLNYIEPDDGRSPEQAWEAGVESTVGELTEVTPQVKVLADIPQLPWKPNECLTDAKATLGTCTAPAEGSEIVSNGLTRKAVKKQGADFVPSLGLVCQEGRCPIVVGDTVTYRDGSHISLSWSKAVARRFGEMLNLKL